MESFHPKITQNQTKQINEKTTTKERERERERKWMRKWMKKNVKFTLSTVFISTSRSIRYVTVLKTERREENIRNSFNHDEFLYI